MELRYVIINQYPHFHCPLPNQTHLLLLPGELESHVRRSTSS
jgi:hypothetical protein